MMTKILCTILSIIGILNSAYAENTTVYLPHKITASSMNYKIEYDTLNRIIKEDIVVLKDEMVVRQYGNSFKYNDDGLIDQKKTVTFATPEDKELNKPEDDYIDYYYYKSTDTLVTANIERRYTTLKGEYSAFVDNQSILFYLNPTKQVHKTIEKTSKNFLHTITEISYDTFSNIESLQQTYIIKDYDYSYQVKTSIMASDKQKGIFKNVHFNPIQRTLQVNNFFLFFAPDNPTYVISESNTNDGTQNSILKEKIELNYSYNEAGYPTSIFCKSSKQDKPEEFKIEYITVKQ